MTSLNLKKGKLFVSKVWVHSDTHSVLQTAHYEWCVWLRRQKIRYRSWFSIFLSAGDLWWVIVENIPVSPERWCRINGYFSSLKSWFCMRDVWWTQHWMDLNIDAVYREGHAESPEWVLLCLLTTSSNMFSRKAIVFHLDGESWWTCW